MPQTRIAQVLLTALLERLYFLIPGMGAVCCVWAALTQVHGGSRTFGSIALCAGAGNIGAAVFILVFGAPGIFRTWRRWQWGLASSAVLAMGAAAVLFFYLRGPSNKPLQRMGSPQGDRVEWSSQLGGDPHR